MYKSCGGKKCRGSQSQKEIHKEKNESAKVERQN